MSRRRLGLIVEGKGEVKALPVLVRRILTANFPEVELDLPEPFLLKRGLMTKQEELSRAVEAMARTVGPGEPVLIVLDADTDSGCLLAPKILEMATLARNDRLVGVVVAVREYEAWLLAGLAPLAGRFGLEPSLPGVENAESLPNPKAWLRRHMAVYSETVDQAILTRHFDISLAQRSYSFDKLVRELTRILQLDPTNPPT
jgi:hypothetical protein